MRQWQARYFELAGHYLKYYENKQTKSDETVKGKIDVNEIGEVVVAEMGGVLTIALEGDGPKKIKLKAASEKAAAGKPVKKVAAAAKKLPKKLSHPQQTY